MFTDPLERAVIEMKKEMTRRIIKEMADRNYKKPPQIRYDCRDCSFLVFKDADDIEPIILCPKYKIGEVVAIAQRYKDVIRTDGRPSHFVAKAGWTNKMFVRADPMPHRIQIISIKIERLQDISDEDCLKEGIYASNSHEIGYGIPWVYTFNGTDMAYYTPREAFAALIDKISGKGTWNDNPFVFVYEFKLVE